MAGMSNTCYKVKILDGIETIIEPRSLLYRKFVCEIVDKDVEATIFQSMSDQGLGPKLYFRNNDYRVESFFEGRALSFWEVRNPTIMQLVAKSFFEFNFNQDAIDKVLAIKPLNIEKLGVDSGVEWAKTVKERLPRIQSKLKGRTDVGARHILSTIEKMNEVFLFDGYEDFFKLLVPRHGNIVLGHCDTQENNILTSLQDNEKLMLIDYEYGDWNPMAYDIANYFNEFCCDNVAPHGVFDCGIQYYEKNFPTRPEREIFAKEYLGHFYKRIENVDATEEDIEKYCSLNLEPFMKEIEQCLMLNNFYWCVWGIMMLKEEEEIDHTLFNWELCRMRSVLFTKQREWFGFGSLAIRDEEIDEMDGNKDNKENF